MALQKSFLWHFKNLSYGTSKIFLTALRIQIMPTSNTNLSYDTRARRNKDKIIKKEKSEVGFVTK